MLHKVLVIDDRWDESDRLAAYKSFEQRSRTQYPPFGLEFDYLPHPVNLQERLASEPYAALLVDVKLTKWPGFSLPQIVREVGDTIPIALLSSYWNDTNSDEVNEAWAKPNCKTFFQWQEIAADGGEGISRALFQLSKIIAEGAHFDFELRRMGLDETINILHISDLEIGGFNTNAIKLEALRSAEEVQKICEGVTPTFIAFTGDVTEAGLPAQFMQAADWLNDFGALLRFPKFPSERLLLVPGNHDICLPLAAAQLLGFGQKSGGKSKRLVLRSKVNELHRELNTFSERPFLDFWQRVSSVAPHAKLSARANGVGSWFEQRYRHLGISFYGVNTCQPTDEAGWPSRTVNADELAFLGRNLRAPSDTAQNRNVVIGMGHHSPMSAHQDRSVLNPEDFATFFSGEKKTAVFLHGHIHERKVEYHSPGGFRLVRSCASTLTKGSAHRPPDSLRGFSLLRIFRDAGQVQGMTASSFDWLSGTLVKNDRAFKLESDGMFVEA
jgi:hypothetical protein